MNQTESAGVAAPELLERYLSAGLGDVDARYRELVQALWNAGDLTPVAVDLLPRLVGAMAECDEARRGQIAVLLGLLIEGADRDVGVVEAVRAGLDTYLWLWAATPAEAPLSLALLYLLAHLPDDRERILAVAGELNLDPVSLSRLDRALQRLDPQHPVLGRVFPSPAAWQADESVREHDRAWIDSLSPELIVENWVKDTRTVLGHLGAAAHWSVTHRARHRPVPAAAPAPETGLPEPVPPDPELLRRWLAALRCPECGGECVEMRAEVGCGQCDARYAYQGGLLDLSQPVASDLPVERDLLLKLAELPTMGLFYESLARPAFLRLSGSNWGGAVTPDDERRYLSRQVRPVDGPVLDLGAGAGTWTGMLADVVGQQRIIALDMATPMLTALRRRLPEVVAIRAGAGALPFRDASLGAVNCWNALQAFPGDAAAAIREIGRCLRPGGTLTLLTFRDAPDPIYRYFVACHYLPQHPSGLRLFDLDILRRWLREAGLTTVHEEYPGTFVMLTAVRRY